MKNTDDVTDVMLVRMPYVFSSPSLALGLLKAELDEAGISSRVRYSSESFIGFLGPEGYKDLEVVVNSITMCWEILFAPAAGLTPRISPEALLQSVFAEMGPERRQDDVLYRRVQRLREIWPELSEKIDEFLDIEAARIASCRPKVVACALMVQERNASVALFRRLKKLLPGVQTILGGGCCAGERGLEFLRVFPEVDYVFSGEADGVFADICRCLCAGDREGLKERHPEILSRSTDRTVPVRIRTVTDLDQCFIPDFTDYFQQKVEHPGGKRYLVLESSRGCWWGEKSPCRFCGLHFSRESRAFREKSPQRFWQEVLEVSQRYECYEIVFSDCVLSRAVIAALPEEAEGDFRKLSLMTECKSTLKAADIRRLKYNCFDALQPGIESLSDEILKIMRKGAMVIDHLSFLKYARIYGVHAVWNILYGVPGEKRAWNEKMLTLMEHIHHLEPPNAIAPLQLAADSVFADEPEQYGLHTVRLKDCEMAKDPPDERFTWKTSQYYYSPDMPPDGEMVVRLREEWQKWRRDFRLGVHLTRICEEECTTIHDARNLQNIKLHHLTGVRKAVYDMAEVLTAEKLLHQRLDGAYSAAAVDEVLAELSEAYLLYRAGGRVLSLATPVKCESYKNRFRPDGLTIRTQLFPYGKQSDKEGN